MTYRSTKKLGPFSCAFRQWRADSHCSFVHGYGLTFLLVFEAEELDDRNWVVDFGGLKSLKTLIENEFDHKLLVAWDDPLVKLFTTLDALNGAQVVTLEKVGCEAFAEHVSDITQSWLAENGLLERVMLAAVECSEHDANSALWINGA